MIVGLLLAAGASTRFGSNKLLHPLADGHPVALHAARNLAQAVPRALAVVRPDNLVLARAFAAIGVEVVACEDSAGGLGASLACGVRACADAQGWLIALGDMPFISPDTIHSVATMLRQRGGIVAPAYGERRGHPVGFGSEFREALAALADDQGARAVIEAHRDKLTLLACNDPGVLRDIDARADLGSD